MAQRCTATKSDGEPCKAYAVSNGTLCAGHSGLGAVGLDPVAAQEASARVRSERARERKLTLLDRIAARLDADAAQIVEEMRSAGRGGDWRATEALITRVHGKPVERVDVQAGTVDVAALSPDQRRALMARVLEDHPGLAELVPRTADVQRAPQARMDTGDSS